MNPTEDNTTVPTAVNASDTKDLLKNAYDIYTDKLPLQACKSQWKKENVFGFLMGVAEYGYETHYSAPSISWQRLSAKISMLFINQSEINYIMILKSKQTIIA